ncbi:MAG: hypothetical protein ABI912_11140 [Actinomycetota bacterium]
MSTVLATEARRVIRGTSPLISWALLAGGVFFLVGGPMHPKEDPPGVSAKEHLRVMYEDKLWFPGHAVLLVGMVLIAVALVALARSRSLSGVPGVRLWVVVAAAAAAAAAPGMLLHLISGVEAHAIAAHRSTPITDVQGVVETITVPAFGFSIAVLAVLGAATRTLGNRLAAVAGVLGGVGYGLAGATILFTDRLDFLFPAATGIALWAIAAGIGLLRKSGDCR